MVEKWKYVSSPVQRFSFVQFTLKNSYIYTHTTYSTEPLCSNHILKMNGGATSQQIQLPRNITVASKDMSW